MAATATIARDRRDAGMTLAADAEARRQPDYATAAYAAIVRIARRQDTVHIDDLIAECSVRPHHPNAAGSVWQKAIRDNVIARCGRSRPCATDPRKNAHDYPVYASLLRPRAVEPAPAAASAPAPAFVEAKSETVPVRAHKRRRPGRDDDHLISLF